MAPGRRSKCSLIRLRDLLIVDLAGAEGLHVDGERVRHADGVCHLDLAAVSQPGCHHVLGCPARRVRRGAVHLRGVLAAESAAAVPAHAAVGIDDDLAPGDAAVAHRSADDKAPGGVDEVIWSCWSSSSAGMAGCDDVFHHRLLDLVVRNVIGVLGADQHRIHAHGFAVGVFHGDLGFAVGVEPGQGAGFAHLAPAGG